LIDDVRRDFNIKDRDRPDRSLANDVKGVLKAVIHVAKIDMIFRKIATSLSYFIIAVYARAWTGE